MNTFHFKNEQDDIARASEILSEGGLVAFPTETVYGLGANALNAAAVANIFTAKGRPADNPLIVHIAEKDQLNGIVAEVPDNAKILMDKFWPGPLTIVMRKADAIPKIVSAGLDTVAVRMPSNETARRLLKTCRLPIAAPSANTSGKPSPTAFQHVVQDMDGKIDAIIDGGSCQVGLESTVVDVTEDIPLLLRPGGVTLEQLRDVLGEVKCNYEYQEGVQPRSPGVKYKHYAPKAEVYIIRGDFQNFLDSKADTYKKAGVLCYEPFKIPNGWVQKDFGASPEDFAANLFALLRAFDDQGVEVIFAQDIDNHGINLAVKNRLYKAAGYKIITEA